MGTDTHERTAMSAGDAVDSERLGYDPRAGESRWRGSPLPPLRDPLVMTEESKTAAERVFWQGPPWGILRNGVAFLHRVVDYGWLEDAHYAYHAVPRSIWAKALDEARPGVIARCSFYFWSHVFGRDPQASGHDWDASRHIQDAFPRADMPASQRERIAALEHNQGLMGDRTRGALARAVQRR